MSPVANVVIHASQFPDAVRRDLLESLRTRCVNHKFHYDNLKQTQKWLALHQAYSPSRNAADCAAVYEQSFAAATAQSKAARIHVIGLGCGGGQKDTRLLKSLRDSGKETFYTPCDVSTAMVLVARQTALSTLPERNCFPLVCDLASTEDLPAVLEKHDPEDGARLFTFFGMIPNFEPRKILPKLASLVRLEDWLLFSANLAPGPDYAAGLERILPQYDNTLTRDWLTTFVLDLGVENSDGDLRFVVEEDSNGTGLKKIVARFQFTRPRRIQIEDEMFDFHVGETIQLFFSYRYTPALVRQLLGACSLVVAEEWITDSQEEGVFLCRRA